MALVDVIRTGIAFLRWSQFYHCYHVGLEEHLCRVINSCVLLPSHSIFWFLGLAENLSLKRIVEPGFYRGVFWGI